MEVVPSHCHLELFTSYTICLIESRDKYLVIIARIILINSYGSFMNENGGKCNQKIKLEIQLKVKLDKILNIETQPLVIGSSH